MTRLLLPMLLLILTATANAASPIYKWTDSAGNIHYEDTHPADVDVEILRRAEIFRGGPAPEEAKSLAAAEKRARTCAEKRTKLDAVLKAPRLYQIDAQGKRSYLSAADHQKYTSDLQAEVAELCKQTAE